MLEAAGSLAMKYNANSFYSIEMDSAGDGSWDLDFFFEQTYVHK